MNWVSFLTGGMTVLLCYGFFSGNEGEIDDHEENELELTVNSSGGRYVTLSCQTCRKLKRHKEVEPNLFQCTKCKRHVDLRAS